MESGRDAVQKAYISDAPTAAMEVTSVSESAPQPVKVSRITATQARLVATSVPMALAHVPAVNVLPGVSTKTNVSGNTQKQYNELPPSTPFYTSDALSPIPLQGDQYKFLSSRVYNIYRRVNPDKKTKPATLDGIRRNGEIWVYVARFSTIIKFPSFLELPGNQ